MTDAFLIGRMTLWVLGLRLLKHAASLPQLAKLADSGRKISAVGSSDSIERVVRLARLSTQLAGLRSGGGCYERALVTHRYLRLRNINSELVVGMARLDGSVRGHAWVVVNGTPIGESASSLNEFVPVARFPTAETLATG